MEWFHSYSTANVAGISVCSLHTEVNYVDPYNGRSTGHFSALLQPCYRMSQCLPGFLWSVTKMAQFKVTRSSKLKNGRFVAFHPVGIIFYAFIPSSDQLVLHLAETHSPWLGDAGVAYWTLVVVLMLLLASAWKCNCLSWKLGLERLASQILLRRNGGSCWA